MLLAEGKNKMTKALIEGQFVSSRPALMFLSYHVFVFLLQNGGDGDILIEEGENGKTKAPPNGQPEGDSKPAASAAAVKFGWITGVLVSGISSFHFIPKC